MADWPCSESCVAEAVLTTAADQTPHSPASSGGSTLPPSPASSVGPAAASDVCEHSRAAAIDTYHVHDQVFSVPSKYSVTGVIGRGAFGVVCSAAVHGGDEVALKRLRVPDNAVGMRRLLREAAVLAHVSSPYAVSLLDCFSVDDAGDHELYLVVELMQCDLAATLAHARLEVAHVQHLSSQLLQGLAHIHSLGVVHRDLKPQNIVVDCDCALKIVDFGLAQEAGGTDGGSYVVTRWYRPPELLLGGGQCSSAVDVWSAGCIVAEMTSGRVLFPGVSTAHQLQLVMERAPDGGRPARGLAGFVRRFCAGPPPPLRAVLAEHIQCAAAAAIVDFCEAALLQFDAAGRSSAAAAAADGCWGPYRAAAGVGTVDAGRRAALLQQLRRIDSMPDDELPAAITAAGTAASLPPLA